jgi:hypothetical protein
MEVSPKDISGGAENTAAVWRIKRDMFFSAKDAGSCLPGWIGLTLGRFQIQAMPMSHAKSHLSCCLAALLALVSPACYTPKKFTRADLQLRAAALQEGRLPPDNLWLRDEYNAYWDGYGWAGEDLDQGLTYSVSRHLNEVSPSVARFFREGYAVGWREYAPDYDPAEYPNALSHLQAASTPSKPSSASSEEQAKPTSSTTRTTKSRRVRSTPPSSRSVPTPSPAPTEVKPRLRKI